MDWSQEHIDVIQHLFPKQRGNVEIDYLLFFHALQYIAKNGCTWRALPKDFGHWNTIYCRFCYWIAMGVFDRIEKALQSQAITIKGIKSLALDSTYIKVHPDGTETTRERLKSGKVTVVPKFWNVSSIV
ncbi:MAG: transposase [Planctomycetaceae bacterium]|nr:transposase [Planctomycetaceae bacterium]